MEAAARRPRPDEPRSVPDTPSQIRIRESLIHLASPFTNSRDSLYSPSISPIGFRSSIRSQHAFTATSIGTASNVPQIPQTKLQKMRPTNIATSLVRAVRLVSHGVSNQPSRLVIASDTAETKPAIAKLPN